MVAAERLLTETVLPPIAFEDIDVVTITFTAVIVETFILFTEAEANTTFATVDISWGIEIVVSERTDPEALTTIFEPIRFPVATTAGVILVAVK